MHNRTLSGKIKFTQHSSFPNNHVVRKIIWRNTVSQLFQFP